VTPEIQTPPGVWLNLEPKWGPPTSDYSFAAFLDRLARDELFFRVAGLNSSPKYAHSLSTVSIRMLGREPSTNRCKVPQSMQASLAMR
jgi:hypothetical protein